MRQWLASFLVILALVNSPALAVEPDEVLDDPVLEARARAISRELRCVVCQSENIDDSNAPLAKDMRLLVRERLEAGDTDEQVIAFFVERYGTYVLLKPPVQRNTMLLWAGPALFAFAAAVGALLILRRHKERAPAPLSADEQRALDEMMQ